MVEKPWRPVHTDTAPGSVWLLYCSIHSSSGESPTACGLSCDLSLCQVIWVLDNEIIRWLSLAVGISLSGEATPPPTTRQCISSECISTQALCCSELCGSH